jgi:DNA-binding transcriptional LysR family regulator
MNPEVWEFPIGRTIVPVAVRPRLVVDTAEAALDAARAGAGIIRLFSVNVAEAVRAGELTVLLEAFEPPPEPVNILYLGGGLQPLKVRAFLDFAAPQLKARLASDLG